MGNIFAEIPGQVGGPRVMLAAHMDEVGIMVQSITEHGWARFITLGAWPGASLPAQRFRFHNRRNQSYIGVTGAVPPHFLREEERQRGLRVEDLHLDFGVPSRQVLADLGVAIGDLGVPDVQPVLLPTGYLVGKAWDDRAGCAVLLDVLQRLAEHPNVLLPVGTVQEEVGTRGMRVAGRELRPDVAIILEGAPTDERPGAAAQTVLGGGPQLRYYDATMIAHRGLVQWLADLAAMEGSPSAGRPRFRRDRCRGRSLGRGGNTHSGGGCTGPLCPWSPRPHFPGGCGSRRLFVNPGYWSFGCRYPCPAG